MYDSFMNELLTNNREITHDLISYAESRKWHLKYAKFNKNVHQSLLSHSLNVMGVSERIFTIYKPTLNESSRYRLLLASFFHDIAKETEVYQYAVDNWLDGKNAIEPSDWEQMDPTIIRNGLKDFMTFTNRSNYEKDLDSIIWIITHMAAPESVAHMQNRLSFPPFGDERLLSEIGRLGDRIMSMQSVDESPKIRFDKEILANLKFEYYKIGVVRGILTQLLHRTIQNICEKTTAIPIAWFPDGTLYATNQPLHIAIEEISPAIRQEFKNLFTEELEEIMGESSYGSLVGTPIKSPEFLFFSEKSVRAFWKRVMNMKFANFNPDKEDSENAKLDNTITNKLRVYNKFLDEGKKELTAKVYTSITFSSSQIIQVLNSAKKMVIAQARPSQKTKKELKEEIDEMIIKKVASRLECVSPQTIPSISQGSSPEERLCLFKELSNTKLFKSLDKWKQRFNQAIIESTILLMHKWKEEVDDPLKEISISLVNDIVKPANIGQVIERARNLNEKYCEGKNSGGTIVCEECGNMSEVRATSPPFEKSETYHDHLVGGQRYGKKNVINVCKLCRFERAIRALLANNGYVIIVYPQLALSPFQRDNWDKIIKKFALDMIGNYDNKLGRYLPRITDLSRWGRIILEEKMPSIYPDIESVELLDQNAIKKIISISFENDIDVAVSYLDSDTEFSNFEDLALALHEGKAKFNAEGLKKLNDSRPERFVYGSPNYILAIVPNISRNNEPPSATSIRLMFLLSILAKLFVASVSTAISNNSSINSNTNNGYVQIERYPSLQRVYSSIGIRGNWIPITELDNIMTRLAGLLLTDGVLKNEKNTPSYGRGQLITISSSLYPGQILNRSLQDRSYLSPTLIRYLQFWNQKRK
jgi:hypothetical protein